VQLDALRRDGALLLSELGELFPQFGFIHTVSFTSSGPSQSS
jgi:hypothetical protein